MIEVAVIKNWDWPPLARQTPGSSGLWKNIRYKLEPLKEADYAIVCNYSPQKVSLACPAENVWCLLQEPPNEYFRDFHNPDKVFARVFCQDDSLTGNRYLLSQPALPWHVNRSYDELTAMKRITKKKNLSFITSAKKDFSGQRERISFLERIRGKIPFDLYGKGYDFLPDKWDGLAPYKYSLAIENFSGPYYWSEKIADCFLAWTMPIYYGCTNISDFFPRESYVQIDINGKGIHKKIEETVKSNLWQKNREAVAYARDLVLNKYQFYPFMTAFIKKWETEKKGGRKIRISIPNENTLINNAIRKFKRILK